MVPSRRVGYHKLPLSRPSHYVGHKEAVGALLVVYVAHSRNPVIAEEFSHDK